MSERYRQSSFTDIELDITRNSLLSQILVEISLIGEIPYSSNLEEHQYIRTKLITKADS
jgi:hypothetical protein